MKNNDQNENQINTIQLEIEKRRLEHESGRKYVRLLRRLLRNLFAVAAIIAFILGANFLFQFYRLNNELIEGPFIDTLLKRITREKAVVSYSKSGSLMEGIDLSDVSLRNPLFKEGGVFLTARRITLNYSLKDVFFGKLILQELKITDPAISLTKDQSGRYVWDFSDEHVSEKPKEQSTEKREKIRPEELADSYLQNIEIKQLSIIAPKPGEIIPEKILTGILKIPTSTWQISGIDLHLRKFPKIEFTDHILQVSAPDKPRFATIQISRLKKSGDISLIADILSKNYIFSIQNRDENNKFIQIFDGRKKDNLNLNFFWKMRAENLFTRVTGFNGKIKLDDFEIINNLLPQGSHVHGRFFLESSADNPQQSILDSKISASLSSASVNISETVNISDIRANGTLKDKIFKFTDISARMASLTANASGNINFTDFDNPESLFETDLSGEKIRFSMKSSKIDSASRRLNASLERDTGNLNFSFVHPVQKKIQQIRDFNIQMKLLPDKAFSTLLPMKIIPVEKAEKIQRWLEEVDIMGPLAVSGYFESFRNIENATATIFFENTMLVNKKSRADSLFLNGQASLASGTMEIKNIIMKFAELNFLIDGSLSFNRLNKTLDEYKLLLTGELPGSKDFSVSQSKIQNTLGLKKPLAFDSIHIKGKKLLEAIFDSKNSVNKISLSADYIKLKQKKKTWLISALSAHADTSGQLFRPGTKIHDLTTDISCDFFGIPVSASASVDISGKNIKSLAIQSRGKNIQKVLDSLSEFDQIRSVIQKYNFSAKGEYNISLKGKGTLNRPNLEGKASSEKIQINAVDAEAVFPFSLSLATDLEGKYSSQISVSSGMLKYKTLELPLEKFNCAISYGREKSAKAQSINLSASGAVLGNSIDLKTDYSPKTGYLNSLKAEIKSTDIGRTAKQAVNIAKINLPFDLSGPFKANVSAKGPQGGIAADGKISISKLKLTVPLTSPSKGKYPLSLDDISGSIAFSGKEKQSFQIESESITGKILDAVVSLSGQARMDKSGNSYITNLNGMNLTLDGLSVAKLKSELEQKLISAEKLKCFKDVDGKMKGSLKLSGQKNRYSATGEVELINGKMGYTSIPDLIEGINGKVILSQNSEKGKPFIEIKNFTSKFRKASLSIPYGKVFDPLGQCSFSVEAATSNVFPQDMMALLSGLKLPKVTFGGNGSLSGEMKAVGTIDKPELSFGLQGGDFLVNYSSDGNSYQIPIGKSSIKLFFDPFSGKANFSNSEVGLLNGKIQFSNATGKIKNGFPEEFSITGMFDSIDLKSFSQNDEAKVRGVLGGKFKAVTEKGGKKDLEINLECKNLGIEKMPLDKAMIDKIGLDFLEDPEFKTGELNFFLSSEGDIAEKGRLRVADALFAGPDLRIELGESAFDPQQLDLHGKIFLNPQPLRKTKLGKKLGKFSKVIQDQKTGIPFVDISVSGKWNQPALLAKSIEKNTMKRGKRNFIRSIFGGSRAHKASVEELKAWFPGWEP
ncbi:MAG: hypothetical protein HQM10_07040 [Candidatus Riflebacteria bacterium]|nr:hypothetical protein [Candidatus Riflebacteria bacterium]